MVETTYVSFKYLNFVDKKVIEPCSNFFLIFSHSVIFIQLPFSFAMRLGDIVNKW